MGLYESDQRNFTSQPLGRGRLQYITDRVKHLSKHAWHFNSMQKLRTEASSASIEQLLVGKNMEKLAATWMKIGRELDAILKGMDDVNDVQEDTLMIRNKMKDRDRLPILMYAVVVVLSVYVSR